MRVICAVDVRPNPLATGGGVVADPVAGGQRGSVGGGPALGSAGPGHLHHRGGAGRL